MLIKDLIQKIPPDTIDRVKQANKRYNHMIREAIRSETRLKLNIQAGSGYTSSRSAVQVTTDTVGYPEEIGNQKISDANRLPALLSLWKNSLTALCHSAKKIGDFLNKPVNEDTQEIVKLIYQSLPQIKKSAPAVLKAHTVADLLLKESNKFCLTEFILRINKDVLGAYFYGRGKQATFGNFSNNSHPFSSSKIKLYWGVIGLVAIDLGLPIEDLTAVVLAHELAHAYTHLGYDINQQKWNTIQFSNSEHGLVEGLAQYYTHRVMHSVRIKIPGGIEAYQKLLLRQSKAYNEHLPWTSEAKPETLRTALITLRQKNSPLKLDEFNRHLAWVKRNYENL